MNTEGHMSPPAIPGTDAGNGAYAYPGYGYPQKPKASGMRIGTGVVAIVLAVVGILFACAFLFQKSAYGASTPFNGWMNFFLIVGSVGSLVTGIVILAKQRKRGGATPWLVTSFAALVVIACLGFMSSRSMGLPGAPVITLPFALAATALAILVIVLEKSRR